MYNLLKETVAYVISTLIHNAPSLILGILIAAIIKVYVDPDKLKNALIKKANISIAGSVAFGAFTPFCACGTMAVVLSMLTTALPWGPIMAFLTSSPLMSPDEFVMISGIISFDFAIALAASSVILGISSGYITHVIEKYTNFLHNQARFESSKTPCGCSEIKASSCCPSAIAQSDLQVKLSCCDQQAACCTPSSSDIFNALVSKYRLNELFKVFYEIGIKKVLIYFSIFAAVGFLINKFVPSDLIIKYLGEGNIFAVPVSALIGLPLYVTGSSSIPIIKTLLEGGASSGAMLAFMITGPGTSAGVIAGIATIMKKKAILLYASYILLGGIIIGYAYDFILIFIR